MGSDGHSHTHHTLRQLLEYPYWTGVQTYVAMVAFADYREYMKDGREIDGWCQGVSGGDTVILDQDEADEHIRTNTDPPGTAYVQAKWTSDRPAYSRATDVVMPALLRQLTDDDLAMRLMEQAIADKDAVGILSDRLEEIGAASLDDIRVVMFFDN